MTFDEASQAIVLRNFRGTWVWDGSTWKQLTTAKSPDTIGGPSTITYDATRRTVDFYGAPNGPTPGSSNMWVFDGSDWAPRSASQAPPSASAAICYDTKRAVVLLLSGATGDTWTWNGETWTKVSAVSGPGPRVGVSLAGASTGEIVAFGGRDPSGFLGDTWLWSDGAWKRA